MVSTNVFVTEISGKYFANDENCETRACTVCEIPDFSYFYLRGEGPDKLLSSQYNQRKDFALLDRIYSLLLESQTNTSSLVFEGQTGLSQITWIPSNKIVSIRRYDDKPIISGSEKSTLNIDLTRHPFGQYTNMRWVFTRVRRIAKCPIFFS